MAQAIRQIGLNILVAILRLVSQPAPRGWQPSLRRPELHGR